MFLYIYVAHLIWFKNVLSEYVYIYGFSTTRVKHNDTSQQARDIDPMLDRCWASVVAGEPVLVKHWVDVSCLLGLMINGGPALA